MDLQTFEYEGNTFMVRPDTMDSYVVKEARAYERHIKIGKTDRWLDGGANIGAFTVRYVSRVEFILAVEPEHRNFKVLRQNVKLLPKSQREKVVLAEAGLVADKRKKIELYLNQAKNPGSHSEFVQRGRSSVKIDAENISELIHKHKINALKLDVEGAEYGLIMDMRPSAMKRLDKVVLEFHFSALKDKKRKMYKKLIEELGYYFKHVDAKDPEDVMKHWHTYVSAH